MQEKTTNQYFSDSASNVSFFFEEKAHDEQGNLRQPKELSINKIGHGGTEPASCASDVCVTIGALAVVAVQTPSQSGMKCEMPGSKCIGLQAVHSLVHNTELHCNSSEPCLLPVTCLSCEAQLSSVCTDASTM